ncbi:MAG: hypothetical protein IT210_17730 [Armatimonadetes bacterium]|nr:hypothetical protein [Armatimonadota bacterium]
MKITDIKSYALPWGSLFVKVETDEGLCGWGECSPMNAQVIRGMIERSLKGLVVGMNPLEIARVWERMFYLILIAMGRDESRPYRGQWDWPRDRGQLGLF